MDSSRSRGHRVVLLAIAAVLIGGGAAGLGTQHSHPLAVISSGLALVAGLGFLRKTRKRR